MTAGDGPTHKCPGYGEPVTPCCGRTPFELPRTDRMTDDAALVTCTAGDGPDWWQQAVREMGGVEFSGGAHYGPTVCAPLLSVASRLVLAEAERRIQAKRAEHFAEYGNEENGPRNYDNMTEQTSSRAAGLIRFHLQNAHIDERDRAELAAIADTLDPALDDAAAVWQFARDYARPSGDGENCQCVNCRAYRAVRDERGEL